MMKESADELLATNDDDVLDGNGNVVLTPDT